MRLPIFIFLAALLLALYQPSIAQTGAKKPPKQQSVTALTQRADKGDAEAQFLLGWLYSTGQDVAQNNAHAIVWYRKAAEQGFAQA